MALELIARHKGTLYRKTHNKITTKTQRHKVFLIYAEFDEGLEMTTRDKGNRKIQIEITTKAQSLSSCSRLALELTETKLIQNL